ncbi:hypothetical protein B7494_g4816 [Chlorociboria aeruginascens]|nr:hypothetical protein B7494_g4816 [Chlorociboria aeruginascens]
MEPPARIQGKRRAVSVQSTHAGPSNMFTSDTSPSPFVSNTKPSETRRPRSSQTVSIGWEDPDDTSSRSRSRLQIELAECVETRTVTTTTTTKRSYPPLLVRPPQSLATLDSKEYPLALKATPAELTKISYEVDGQLVDIQEDDSAASTQEILQEGASKCLCSHFDSKTDREQLNKNQGHKPFNWQKPEAQRSQKQDMRLRRRLSKLESEGPHSPDSIVGKPHHVSESIPRSRRYGLGMHMVDNTILPATPETSDMNPSFINFPRPNFRSTFANTFTPQSGASQNESFEDAPSPFAPANQEMFPSAVATPPIAESDLEPFEEVNSTFVQARRPSLNTAAAQNTSLPSPGLSPTVASAELHTDFTGDREEDEFAETITNFGDSQQTVENARSMIDSFDAMPADMKTFMMYQLLRRCPRKTLNVIASTVNPVLKCDFMDQLPLELSLNIISFLDYQDLCRAARVSKQWRHVIDSNETGWKELIDRDGLKLSSGELERAIQQGWGWQDPYGPDAAEQDLSVQRSLTSSDGEIMVIGNSKLSLSSRKRSAKRKRVPGNLGSAKRRAGGHDFPGKAKDILTRNTHTTRYHKSEGPLTAANAAILAVPDPGLGLPGLRRLHLFKSLYRRLHMFERCWTSPTIEPHHMAFPAHPAHVITCLQFDDDKILTGSDDTRIHVYDTKTGELRKKLEGHEGGVWALQYEGNVLVSGSTDRSVRVWDIEKGLCTQVFHGHTSTVRCLQILMPVESGEMRGGKPVMVPEKPLIITGSRDSQLRVWKLPEQGSKRYIQTGPPANDADCPYFLRVLSGHTHSVRAIAAHQDVLVSGSYDNTVRVWKISTGETVHRLQGHTMKVYSVVLDHKRNRCISGSMDNFVKIWSLETGACLRTLEGHTSLVGLLDLRDDRVVSAAADSTLRVWDPQNGTCKNILSAHTGAITCFQHDGHKIISGSDRTLKMWDVRTGECIKDLLIDLSGVWQVKFDRRRCVAAVQRDNLTFVEVLDFGAYRDGIPASQRGYRILLKEGDGADRSVEELDS